jgi:hypothetical protein
VSVISRTATELTLIPHSAGGVGKRCELVWDYAGLSTCLSNAPDRAFFSALTMRFVRDVFVDSYNPTIEGVLTCSFDCCYMMLEA